MPLSGAIRCGDKPVVYYRSALLILIISGLLACGHRRNPTGGEKDTVNPSILAVLPEEFSDISTEDIEITFSKPMDRSSLSGGITIYPPILKKKFRWQGNDLTIQILEQLEEDTNYFISLSPQIRGEHGNELDQHYLFIFRSGELNRTRISGAINYEDPADNGKQVRIILQAADSTFILTRFFRGSSYLLENLNKESHILQAFIDLNSNKFYDYGREPYFRAIVPLTEAINIDLEMAYEDTIRPGLKSALVPARNQIRLEFTEPVSAFEEVMIETADSLALVLPVLQAKLQENYLYLLTTDQDTIRYQVTLTGLTDRKQNRKESATLLVDGSVQPDTIPPFVKSFTPRKGSTVATLEPEINLVFSELIDQSSITAQLAAVESSEIINLVTDLFQSDSVVLSPEKPLRNYTSYRLLITLTDPAGNELADQPDLVFIPIVRE